MCARAVHFSDVERIQKGQHTAVFARHVKVRRPPASVRALLHSNQACQLSSPRARHTLHSRSGATLHEFVLGTKKDLDEHAAMMVKFPTMEHDEPYMAHVASGKTGEIIWTLNRAGEFDFACLIAGHYQAGMVGKIRVKPSTKGST